MSEQFDFILRLLSLHDSFIFTSQLFSMSLCDFTISSTSRRLHLHKGFTRFSIQNLKAWKGTKHLFLYNCSKIFFSLHLKLFHSALKLFCNKIKTVFPSIRGDESSRCCFHNSFQRCDTMRIFTLSIPSFAVSRQSLRADKRRKKKNIHPCARCASCTA